MIGKGIILLADNIAQFVDTRAELLDQEGYKVIRAYSFNEAEKILQTRWLHLAILDIRLESDEDEEDTSGLDLARNERYRSIPKMILTGFPTVDNVREALQPEPDGMARVLRHVAKKEGAAEMIRNVNEIFRDFIQINTTLRIHWKNQSLISLAHIATLLDNQLTPAQLHERIEELEDLLRSLFFKSDQLTISRLLWSREGRLVLDGTLFSGEASYPVLLQISLNPDEPAVRADLPRGSRGPAPQVPGAEHASSTLHFVARAWRLEHSLEDALPLGEYIRQNPERRASAVIENLFANVLAPWYQFPLVIEETSPDRVYGNMLAFEPGILNPGDLEGKVLDFLRTCISARLISSFKLEGDRMNLQLQNGYKVVFDCPWNMLGSGISERRMMRMVCSPGSITAYKVMVDRAGNITLTDRESQELVPCEWDFTRLEADLYLNSLETHDILAIYTMLSEIIREGKPTGLISAANVDVECRKVLSSVVAIRRMAEECFQITPLDYALGLFFTALHHFSTYEPNLKRTGQELLHYLQFLMLCGLITELLNEKVDRGSQTANAGITVDEANHEFFLDGQPLNLTPTEYDLLLYLFKKDGNLCRRSEIMKAVFNSIDSNPVTEKSLLNTNVGRLRAKIEKDADNPSYILTVRGQGYKLVKTSG